MIPALLAAGLSFAVSIPARWLGRRFRLVSREGIALTGGLGVLVSWWIVAAGFGSLPTDTRATFGLALAMLPLVAVGVWDVRSALRPSKQLLAQALAAAAVVVVGGIAVGSVTNPFGGIVRLDAWMWNGLPIVGATISLAWIMVLMNAVNLLDGADGLAAMVSMVGFLAVGVTSFLPNVAEPTVGRTAFVAAGATAGFLFWNYPPARLYLGTPGAWFLGLLLAVLSLLGSSKIATLSVVAALPLLDAAAVAMARLRRGASLFRGDTTHFHHVLAGFGWSPRKILLTYMLISALLGVAAVVLPTPVKAVLVAACGVALALGRRGPKLLPYGVSR